MTIRTYALSWGWVVSDKEQWLPGCYDTEVTARRAAEFSNAQLDSLGPIYRADGESRLVTMADLDRLERP